MTREEARKAAEVMLAYANGEEIETICIDDKYQFIENPSFNWGVSKYRIKPKPTFRPFKDKEECWNEMLKHKPFGWLILKGGKYPDSKVFITKLTENCFYFTGDGNGITYNFYDYKICNHSWLFADGTPFGIKEE